MQLVNQETDNKYKMDEYYIKLKSYREKKLQWDENEPRIFATLLLHCTPNLIKATKKLIGYKVCCNRKAVIKLLCLIQAATHDSDKN